MSESRDKMREITIAELYKKKTSPKTLEIQGAKTATSTAHLAHDCTTEGAYSNPKRREMQRERLYGKSLRYPRGMKPKRKVRYERSLVESIPLKGKLNARGVSRLIPER